MRSFSWLHLSDLHFGLAGQAPLWPNVREAFFNDLTKAHESWGPFDAVFFTGDLVQSGKQEEFLGLETQFLSPLWAKLRELGSHDTVLITVPGNHDLLRPDSKKPTAALRQLLRQDGFQEIAEEFWSDQGCEYRTIVNNAFENYQKWSSRHPYKKCVEMREGVLPGDFLASLTLPSADGDALRIGIVGINTTYLQLADGDFEGRLAISPRQLHIGENIDLPTWSKGHHVCVLLSHQGPDWLNTQSRQDAYPEINPAGRFAVHVFGHMHENVTRSTTMGGGRPLRQWQAMSMFGMEKWGQPPQFDRRHGYSIGRIEFDERTASIRQWPRKAIRDSNGWRFDRDSEKCVLEEDGGTTPEAVDIQEVSPISAPSVNLLACGPSKVESIGRWPWPHAESSLTNYCEEVCRAHSHIRFVEIPFLKDITDVAMDSLYVEPRFSLQEIHPDQNPSDWPQSISAFDALKANSHLVLLGDPGSGKSTLVSYIAWKLCQPTPTNSEWVREFGGRIPFPIVLRELSLKADLTWETLLEAVLKHTIGRLLPNREFVEVALRDGRAIVMLDGLDEIGNLTVRKKLRDAVHDGMCAYPKSSWILTSRMVGYDLVPFHFKTESVNADSYSGEEMGSRRHGRKSVRTSMADVMYLAPFNDNQIKEFSTKWYFHHERETERRQISADELVTAIRENDGTQRLARIPYLLTLMALVHHKNARLPHGRTELYERIATAYLESIDLRRKLDQLPYSLVQKKRWLSEIAFRMQLARVKSGQRVRNDGSILATRELVQRWLRAAMRQSGVSDTKPESATLIDYFAQRSGLLLPRGEGRFAFMHLSLQEYFCACFLEPRLTASRFSLGTEKLEPTDKELREWANNETWQETLVLLFELLSDRKSKAETEAFLTHLFEDRLEGDPKGREATAAGLLAELVTNSFVSLSTNVRRKMRQQCWRWVFGLNEPPGWHDSRANKTLRYLLAEADANLQHALKIAGITNQEIRRVRKFSITVPSGTADLAALSKMHSLMHLFVAGAASFNVNLLTELRNLQWLNLEACGSVSNLEPLAELKDLRCITLGQSVNLAPLATLPKLRELHLHFQGAIDLTPIANCRNLLIVCVDEDGWALSEELLANSSQIASPGVREIIQRRELGVQTRSPVRLREVLKQRREESARLFRVKRSGGRKR